MAKAGVAYAPTSAIDRCVQIESDFGADVRTEFLSRLLSLGIDATEVLTTEAAAYRRRGLTLDEGNWIASRWFSVDRKLIASQPRQVIRSQELRARTFPAHIEGALRDLEAACVRGDDLTPYLSDKWRDLGHNDHLLNEWAIHHLHLGGVRRSKRRRALAPRSRELLFVMVFRNAILWIDVGDHGRSSFADEQLLRIVMNNWPQHMERFRMPGVLPGSSLSPADISQGRHCGLTMPVTIGGHVFVPIGGGQATTGFSVRAIRAADDLTATARAWREWIEENSAEIATEIERVRGEKPSGLSVALHFEGRRVTVKESNLAIEFKNLSYAL